MTAFDITGGVTELSVGLKDHRAGGDQQNHLVHSEKGQFMGVNTKAVTDSSFETDVLKSSTPVLVDFWAEWCGPCKAIGPRLEEIAAEMSGKVVVAKLNIDENPGAPAKYGVRGIPTLIMFKDGKEIDQLVGAHPKDKILDLIKKHI